MPFPMWDKALVTENTLGIIHNDCSSPPPARASRASFSTFQTGVVSGGKFHGSVCVGEGGSLRSENVLLSC